MRETEWGRKETAIWPPHQSVFTLGWFFVALAATGLFLWLTFAQALSPFQQFYLPVYLKSALAETFRPTGKYRFLLMADGKKRIFYAREQDVTNGSTPQWKARPLPLALSDSARAAGMVYLFRGAPATYANRSLHDWLTARVYDGNSPIPIFKWAIIGGALVFILPLPYWIIRDIRRRKQMKYGRRLRGPVLVSPRGFNRAVRGDGVGFNVCWHKQPMRIPRAAEDHHIEIIGDTGSGKTTLIMQILRQVEERGHPAIVYDPACEFIQRFYKAERGDIVLNPLDRRCPYWGPSEELVRRSEARTLAASLFQHPEERTKHEFFIETPQKIFAKLLLDLPTPQQLIEWMSNEEEIDKRVQGTELAAMIDPSAPNQRSGVLGSLNLVADSFRLLPAKEEAKTEWTAREWSKHRRGWIFMPSQASEREALRPLHSFWIDMLVLRLLTAPSPGQPPVWFVLDELATLQKLPQLHTAITENRKSGNPLVLGFQGKAQLEVIYGHLAEVMLSQPATRIFLKTGEPEAAQWVSRAIGNVEVERVKETRYEGWRAGQNFTVDRQIEPLVLDSEISGMDPMRAYLKHGNYVARFSFRPVKMIADEKLKFIERLHSDYIVREPKAPTETVAAEQPDGKHSVAPAQPPKPDRNGRARNGAGKSGSANKPKNGLNDKQKQFDFTLNRRI
ncbi:MAG: type IV secretion system DNA-binding domain-containing protein [Acidobacteriaceae bacterium]